MEAEGEELCLLLRQCVRKFTQHLSPAGLPALRATKLLQINEWSSS